MSDPDQNYLSCASKTTIKRSLLSNRAVTSILKDATLNLPKLNVELYKVSLLAPLLE